MKNGRMNTLFLVLVVSTLLSLLLTVVYGEPVGPTVSILGNTTKNVSSGALVNQTVNGSTPGGYIFTASVNSIQQNTRWKAYVGNVTGTLTLDDANDNTIFQWSLTTTTGEIYATRTSGTVNWTGINCTWIADGQDNLTSAPDNTNRTPEHNENEALSHTGVDDNITATFNTRNHSSMVIGSVVIGKNECFTAVTYQNDAVQTFDDSDNANFSVLILYDGAYNTTEGNVVYATPMEEDIPGFNGAETYDFQIILPEDGSLGFSGSTGYYFYVELS